MDNPSNDLAADIASLRVDLDALRAEVRLFVPRTELDGKFLEIASRITGLETRAGEMAKAQQALQTQVETTAATINANTAKLDDILAFMRHANTWLGFMKKHGPKVATFALGVAITKGWVTAENGRNFLSIFGL